MLINFNANKCAYSGFSPFWYEPIKLLYEKYDINENKQNPLISGCS